MPDVAEYLEHELARARIVSGRVHAVTLVYPAESDIEHGRVSVLTPIGAALVGLSQGQSIEWNTRSGEPRQLTVVALSNDN